MLPQLSHNLARFTSLPVRVQDEAQTWMHILQAVAGAANKSAAIRYQAERHVHMRGFSAKNIIRKYYAWRKAPNDMTVLINKARLPARQANDMGTRLPSDFIHWWKKLCERNQRKSKPAYRDLCRRWRNGDDIPGYGTWRDWYAAQHDAPAPDGYVPELPRGWSYGNLMRHAPAEFELAAARIGRAAVARFRPLVFTSRVGLEVGQFYVFDDLEHDLKVNVPGVNHIAMRPLELAALDLFSGCKFAYGLKPTLIDDDGAKEKLKEREMRFLLAYILTRLGYGRRARRFAWSTARPPYGSRSRKCSRTLRTARSRCRAPASRARPPSTDITRGGRRVTSASKRPWSRTTIWRITSWPRCRGRWAFRVTARRRRSTAWTA